MLRDYPDRYAWSTGAEKGISRQKYGFLYMDGDNND